MNIPQRKRRFELGEDVIAEAVLDVLRTNSPEYLVTSVSTGGLRELLSGSLDLRGLL